MADLGQIRKKIAEIATKRKNVDLEEIIWVVHHLGMNGYETAIKKNDHQHLFRINRRRFGVCHHNPGNRQIKAHYVNDFLDVMAELELCEE
jgi:hypothetical protein